MGRFGAGKRTQIDRGRPTSRVNQIAAGVGDWGTKGPSAGETGRNGNKDRAPGAVEGKEYNKGLKCVIRKSKFIKEAFQEKNWVEM